MPRPICQPVLIFGVLSYNPLHPSLPLPYSSPLPPTIASSALAWHVNHIVSPCNDSRSPSHRISPSPTRVLSPAFQSSCSPSLSSVPFIDSIPSSDIHRPSSSPMELTGYLSSAQDDDGGTTELQRSLSNGSSPIRPGTSSFPLLSLQIHSSGINCSVSSPASKLHLEPLLRLVNPPRHLFVCFFHMWSRTTSLHLFLRDDAFFLPGWATASPPRVIW
ncbi:hypothetical protein SUGI_0527570 [Cryptomeria japonica]|nr:hypothetical protein SUGI_0527570 [Cryptomeria japonica]